MVYSLSYRRPAHVSSNASITSVTKSFAGASFQSGSSGSIRSGIPEALSFDRVIAGGVCPPCTTRDFMNYLIYVERAAENLQFYLWFRDFVKRFEGLPASEKVLSPPWANARGDPGLQSLKSTRSIKPEGEIAAVFKGTAFEAPPVATIEQPTNPFEEDDASSKWDGETSTLHSSVRQDSKKTAAAAFEAANIKLQPFTVQPFRAELTRIISIYIADGSPRQLNLAARERTELLQALAVTTHPSAFHKVSKTVEWTLRHQAHPNFVRWTICNGNRPRVVFARGLGTAGVVVGLVTIVLLTISKASRGWRAIAAIPLLIGVATLFAAWKGMCVVLHGMHHRHLRPWELFADDAEASIHDMYEMKLGSEDSLSSSNSYEDEPWVAKYEKRNLLRKVLDREVWIQEPALRQIQDTIFVQGLLTAVLVTAVVVGAFVAVPQINRI